MRPALLFTMARQQSSARPPSGNCRLYHTNDDTCSAFKSWALTRQAQDQPHENIDSQRAFLLHRDRNFASVMPCSASDIIAPSIRAIILDKTSGACIHVASLNWSDKMAVKENGFDRKRGNDLPRHAEDYPRCRQDFVWGRDAASAQRELCWVPGAVRRH